MSRLADSYVGCLSFWEDGPRRFSSNKLVCAEGVKKWATEQAILMSIDGLNQTEKYLAAMNVAYFGGDPTPVASIFLTREVCGLEAIYDKLKATAKLLAPVRKEMGQDGNLILSQIQYSPTPGMSLSLWDDVTVLPQIIEAWEPWSTNGKEYHAVPSETNRARSSFLACLTKYAFERGDELLIDDAALHPVGIYIGEQSARDKLTTGQQITMHCICLSIRER